jgi:hypothetical protein
MISSPQFSPIPSTKARYSWINKCLYKYRKHVFSENTAKYWTWKNAGVWWYQLYLYAMTGRETHHENQMVLIRILSISIQTPPSHSCSQEFIIPSSFTVQKLGWCVICYKVQDTVFPLVYAFVEHYVKMHMVIKV